MDTKMADAKKFQKNSRQNDLGDDLSFTTAIPMMEKLRKEKGPVDSIPGLPQSPRPPQQIRIENVMESCIFKSTLAGVLGTKVLRLINKLFL